MQIPASQATLSDGLEEIKPSSSERSAQGVIKKGLRFHDMIMLVRWGRDGKPEIQMDIKREHVKAIHNSQNPILFLFAMSLVSRAFKDCDTVDEIFNLEIPHCNRLILEWATHMLQLPISKVLTYPGPTTAIQEPSLFSRQMKKAAQLPCYNNITAFDFRGVGLTRTNNRGYSNAERMEFVGHKTYDTYWIHYVAKGSVNGFLRPVFQRGQLPTGEKTPTETPERQRQIANSEENFIANPQTRKCDVTPGKLMPLETDEPGEIPVANPADISPHNNRHDGLILTVRRSSGNHK